MSELKIDKNSIQNAILKDGQIVSGVISNTGNNSSINSSGTASVAVGYATTNCSINATNIAAVAIGGGFDGDGEKIIEASGQCSFAGGKIYNAGKILAKETGSFAHGQVASGGVLNASGLGSFVHGQAAHISKSDPKQPSIIQTRGNGAHAEGYADYGGIIDASGFGSYASGCASTGAIQAYGNGSYASGYVQNGTIVASGNGAHAEGFAQDGSIVASGNGAHAEGCTTKALTDGAHAEGSNTIASGVYSHAEGAGNTFSLGNVRAVVSTTQYTLSRITATIEGTTYTLKVGDIVTYNSIYAKVTTIRENTITIDKALGATIGNTISLVKGISYGGRTHSEGYLTAATENQSHTEGYLTMASGFCSHAEGYNTTASGAYSHAEGQGTIASGGSSHAGGLGTIADVNHVTAIGQYNENCASGDLLVIGNGTQSNASSRSNAFSVNSDDNKKVTITIGDQITLTSYKRGENGIGAIQADENLTITSDGPLDIQGSDSPINIQGYNGVNVYCDITVTGEVHASGGFYDESDIRKKDILSTISLEKSYELLDKCQEIIYTLKEDPNKKEQLGMIAQEVEEFFPEIVSTDNNGFKSLDYARLSVICLRLIKDIVEQIKELKNEIKNLKKLNS